MEACYHGHGLPSSYGIQKFSRLLESERPGVSCSFNADGGKKSESPDHILLSPMYVNVWKYIGVPLHWTFFLWLLANKINGWNIQRCV